MSKNNAIQIFLRIRPIKKPTNKIILNKEENKLEFKNLVNKEHDIVNNSIEKYNFSFNDIFDANCTQEDVFDGMAKEIIDNAFNGYNGTIFAYGQTGSGKTFTMTGGEEKYEDRGIIPRTISYIFDKKNKITDKKITITVSYLEIYNNNGYDLLSENQNGENYNNLKDLEKIKPKLNENKELVLSNLGLHEINNLEDALNLLFLGDTNRVICETPMNDVSTRSHCIFSLIIESQNINSQISTVGKINLVDLSGSERVDKSGITGKILKEACNINSSLFYLQEVIMNLQERSEGKDVLIPYRNSFMTLMLRDSLGGNCLTKMIFTINPKEDYNKESISTCLFSQKVALIKNIAKVNEKIDLNKLVARLQKENQELKEEIRVLKGEEKIKEFLTEEDKENVKEVANNFIENKIDSIFFSDKLMTQYTLFYLKTLIKNTLFDCGNDNKKGNDNNKELKEEIQKLEEKIKSQSLEITMLINKLNKDKKNFDDTIISNIPSNRDIEFPDFDKNLKSQLLINNYTNIEKKKTKKNNNDILEIANNFLNKPSNLNKEQLKDKMKLKEWFRINYRKKEALNEDRLLLKENVDQAKKFNEILKNSKNKITILKSQLDCIKKNNYTLQITDPNYVNTTSEEEKKILNQIEKLRETQQNSYIKIKSLRNEMESIQTNAKNKIKIFLNDFEKWYSLMKNYYNDEDVNKENNQSMISDKLKDSLDPETLKCINRFEKSKMNN